MKESKITKVMVELNGEKIEVEVKHNIPFMRRATCASIIAKGTVLNDGTFEPWNRIVYQYLVILTEYADMPIPTDWGNDEIDEFVNTDDFKQIWNAIDSQEFAAIVEMAEEMIEHRKQTCRRNGFYEFLDNVKGTLESVMKIYNEAPELAEQLVGGLLETIMGKPDTETVDEDVVENELETIENGLEAVENEVFAEENEVEDNADV